MTETKRVRKASLPIPEAKRQRFFLDVWDMAWAGYFCQSKPKPNEVLPKWGSGSIIARRNALAILWLTAMAGRFNEIANARLTDVNGDTIDIHRSKRGAVHSVRIDPYLVACTMSWHAALGAAAIHPKNSPHWRRQFKKMQDSQYLLPNQEGRTMSTDVFNRDVANKLGELHGFRCSSHSFRDTACQEAMRAVKADANLDIRAVQTLLGHKSLRTTEVYIRKQEAAQLSLTLYT
ncbi:tyrosine-type recombinase/integrase [Aureliella helgolandensis]|uniref:Site-specific tyrosine recombinase XerC n=1 Tax=Aureliella helgolandensis TaxID=2527968 RepID=A0A518G766_9BACT|nr:site-specific integrase [Aureliella helgolandensis]QDV24411.1 site-specific tyrosine recombinase XerC [Aureliella helgolandensis]